MTDDNMTSMLKECYEIPAIVSEQLNNNQKIMGQLCERIATFQPQYVVTIARGSSDNAANYAKYLFESQLGLVTASASPSIVTLYQKPLNAERALAIGFSQSGKSPDICQSLQAMRDGGALTVAFVNKLDSPLAEIAEVVIPMGAGEEHSVAATKSFIVNLTALLQLMAIYNVDDALSEALVQLPHYLKRAQQTQFEDTMNRLKDSSTLFTLGRGLGYPIAQEMALKLKETAIIHAECYSGADMLHGPIAVVHPQNPVLTLCQSDETLESTLDLLAALQQANATNVVIYQQGNPHQQALQQCSDVLWELPNSLHGLCDPVIAIQAFYPMVELLSRTRGYHPDTPPFLNKVTKTV